MADLSERQKNEHWRYSVRLTTILLVIWFVVTEHMYLTKKKKKNPPPPQKKKKKKKPNCFSRLLQGLQGRVARAAVVRTKATRVRASSVGTTASRRCTRYRSSGVREPHQMGDRPPPAPECRGRQAAARRGDPAPGAGTAQVRHVTSLMGSSVGW